MLYVANELVESMTHGVVDASAAYMDRQENVVLDAVRARRFEVWEGNVAGKIGLGTAARYATSWGLENICERVSGLAGYMRSQLAAIPELQVLDEGTTFAGSISFRHGRLASHDVQRRLSVAGIDVAVSDERYCPKDHEVRGLGPILRASTHYYTTEDEIEACLQALREFS
jgi:selenocysteine lyase/cysteine desulfurase